MQLRTLIVDDEAHARGNLQFLIAQYCPELEVVGTADSVSKAEEMAIAFLPQLVFLDISMPAGIEGFYLLDRLAKKNLQVVFVTAFREYAQQALEANAIEYLLKPVDIDDLRSTVNRVIQRQILFTNSPDQSQTYCRSLENLSSVMIRRLKQSEITVSHDEGYSIVDPSAIMYLATEGQYTTIVFNNGTICKDIRPINVYDEVLGDQTFFRIHKSHIINLTYLKSIQSSENTCVVLKNNVSLPLARQRVSELTSRYSQKYK